MTKTDALKKTVDEFCQFIEQLPAAALADREWGPKEVLTHILYHHENYGDDLKTVDQLALRVGTRGQTLNLSPATLTFYANRLR